MLLERTTRRIVLTEKGSLFYRRAVSILALAEEAKREAMHAEEIAGDRGYALTEELNVPLIIMEPIKGGLPRRSEPLQKRHRGRGGSAAPERRGRLCSLLCRRGSRRF